MHYKTRENARVVKGADGLLHRQNRLEFYYEKGWLNFGNKKITPNDKLSAGLRFQRDFYHSRIDTMTAINWAKERVDTSPNTELPAFVWDARKRFIGALRAIKPEHLRAVQVVVLEDKALRVKFVNKVYYTHYLEEARSLLCGGLDDLAIYYGLKPVTTKVVGYTEKYFWEAA